MYRQVSPKKTRSYNSSTSQYKYSENEYTSSLDDVVYHEYSIEQTEPDSYRSHELESSHDRNRCDPESFVAVFLLTGRPDNKNVKRLINYFRPSKFFKLHVVDIAPPVYLDINNKINQQQAIEIFRFQYILKLSAKKYPKQSVLILKDTSVAASPVGEVQASIKTAFGIGDWDFFYLTRWLDLCDLYTNPVKVKNSMNKVVESFSPNGTQAILFSQSGRDIVIGKRKMRNGQYFTPITIPLSSKLNEEITLRNVKAVVTAPNLFEFDVFQALTTADLAKLSDCRRPQFIEDNPSAGNISILWFVVVVIIVLLLAWALYMIGPSNHGRTKDKS